MSSSRTYTVDGTQLLIPDSLTELPFSKLDACPDCCGAGRGLGEKLIPEKVFGLRISAACWIHDRDWELAEPTWDAFHAANGRLLHNMVQIITIKSSNMFIRTLRIYRPSTYFAAVSTAGAGIFKKLKRTQGHDISGLS